MNKTKIKTSQIDKTERNAKKSDESTFIKVGRSYYFEIQISLGVITKKTQLLNNEKNLVRLLKINKFITQKDLETALLTFQFDYHNKPIKLKDFFAQLEHDPKTNAPMWRIVVETPYLITGKSLAISLSQQLYQTSGESIDPTIKVVVLSQLKTLEAKNKLTFTKKPWLPGYFDKKILKYTQEFERNLFLNRVTEDPEIYDSLVQQMRIFIERYTTSLKNVRLVETTEKATERDANIVSEETV